MLRKRTHFSSVDPESWHFCNALHHDQKTNRACTSYVVLPVCMQLQWKSPTMCTLLLLLRISASIFRKCVCVHTEGMAKKGCYLVKSLNRSHFNFILIFCIDLVVRPPESLWGFRFDPAASQHRARAPGGETETCGRISMRFCREGP